jgi:predicted GIY-YIG superfamily endonuclease
VKGNRKASYERWASANPDKITGYQRAFNARGTKHAAKPYVYIARHNDYFYIGCTKMTWRQRFSRHKCDADTGLHNYIKEHNLSKKDFATQIIEFDTKAEARALEKVLIARDLNNPLCLNRKH